MVCPSFTFSFNEFHFHSHPFQWCARVQLPWHSQLQPALQFPSQGKENITSNNLRHCICIILSTFPSPTSCSGLSCWYFCRRLQKSCQIDPPCRCGPIISYLVVLILIWNLSNLSFQASWCFCRKCHIGLCPFLFGICWICLFYASWCFCMIYHIGCAHFNLESVKFFFFASWCFCRKCWWTWGGTGCSHASMC